MKCAKNFIRHEKTMPKKFYDCTQEERKTSVLLMTLFVLAE